jgi:pyruvate formate lyase activating enzyme
VNDEPLSEIISFTDAFNIDLKAFSDSFYKKLTGASLGPVLNSLKRISAAGRHLEITTLIIPGINDSVSEMARQAEWISGELGKDVPLHLSRYFPAWKRNDPPTPKVSLEVLTTAASQFLDYVYLGNSGPEGQDTYCPSCGIKITSRSGYRITHVNLDDKGKCKGCGSVIYRNFSPTFPTVR